jgi:O-acetyl-ADP-ribose deacetylase (regulator of RNase III)
VKWIVHILSIIKHTPEGAWCPKPEKLRDGVRKGLELAAAKGATSIALSMLGTGEGRVTYADAARLMVAGVKDFRRGFTGEMEIVFSLTNARGYDAVRDHLAARL